MTGFNTRVMPRSDSENYSYEIIIDTDEEEKYKTIQEFCRALIDHSKPTSNIVEVVICKDCRYFKPHGNTGYCDKPAALLGELKPDDYCSFGERKKTE